LKNIFVSLLVLFSLAACGMSEGDSVIVLPNDSPFRSDISITRHGISSNSITGSFVKKDGDKVVISDAKGKLRTFNANEVFSASDENAQELSKARLAFYKASSQNSNALDKPEILELIKEKAEKAKLYDWVELLEIVPDLKVLNEKLRKNRPVSVDLIGEWDDTLDSLDDLEDEIAQLSQPDKGRMNFSQAFNGIMKLSVLNAINQWVRGYAQYKQVLQNKRYMNSNIPDLAALPTVVENAMKFASLRVKEARHLALLRGKKLTDDQLDAVRRETMKTIIDATIVAAIKIANDELGNKISGERLAEFLVEKIGYPKDGLAQFYGKKSWDSLLASVKEQDQWLAVFMADDWNGKIKINRGYKRITVLDSNLIFTFESSLLKPVAILSYGKGMPFRGHVEKNSGGIRIKDDLGKWNWQGALDDEGTLLVNGNFPQGYSKFDIHAKFYSPAAIKRIEVAKKVKVQQLTSQLKSEPWYGVTFINRGQHIVPYPVLIKLDFNQNSFSMRDIGYDSKQTASTSLTFEINANAKGSFTGQAGKKTRHWVSGSKWEFSLNEDKLLLTATIARAGRNPGWKVMFIPQRDYTARLQLMGSLTNSSWKSVMMNRKGEGRSAGKESMKIINVSVKNDRAIFKVEKRHAGRVSKMKYIAVPALERGVVISIEKNSRRLTGFREVYYSHSPFDEHAIFRNWDTFWGIAKTSGGSMPEMVKNHKQKIVDSQVDQMPDNALLKAARKQGVISSRANMAAAPKQQVIVAQPAKPSVQHAALTHAKPKAAVAKHKPVKAASQHHPKRQNAGISRAESHALNQGIKTLEALL